MMKELCYFSKLIEETRQWRSHANVLIGGGKSALVRNCGAFCEWHTAVSAPVEGGINNLVCQ